MGGPHPPKVPYVICARGQKSEWWVIPHLFLMTWIFFLVIGIQKALFGLWWPSLTSISWEYLRGRIYGFFRDCPKNSLKTKTSNLKSSKITPNLKMRNIISPKPPGLFWCSKSFGFSCYFPALQRGKRIGSKKHGLISFKKVETGCQVGIRKT